MRACVTATAALMAVTAVPGVGEAQSHGRRCSTSDTGYVYTISTPAGDSRQHDIDVYFNRDDSAFIVVVFDADSDVKLATSSGLQSGDRFVHGSLRMYPDETYRISVGCVLAGADYRLSVKRGEEVTLSAPRTLNAHEGLTAAEAAMSFEIESVMRTERQRLSR